MTPRRRSHQCLLVGHSGQQVPSGCPGCRVVAGHRRPGRPGPPMGSLWAPRGLPVGPRRGVHRAVLPGEGRVCGTDPGHPGHPAAGLCGCGSPSGPVWPSWAPRGTCAKPPESACVSSQFRVSSTSRPHRGLSCPPTTPRSTATT